MSTPSVPSVSWHPTASSVAPDALVPHRQRAVVQAPFLVRVEPSNLRTILAETPPLPRAEYPAADPPHFRLTAAAGRPAEAQALKAARAGDAAGRVKRDVRLRLADRLLVSVGYARRVRPWHR